MSEHRPGHHDDDEPTKSGSSSSFVAVLALLLALVAIGIGFGGWNRPKQNLNGYVTVKQYNDLAGTVQSLRDSLTYLKAHTDTTGMSDMREQFVTLTGMVEQRAADLDRLQKEVNHFIINGK